MAGQFTPPSTSHNTPGICLSAWPRSSQRDPQPHPLPSRIKQVERKEVSRDTASFQTNTHLQRFQTRRLPLDSAPELTRHPFQSGGSI